MKATKGLGGVYCREGLWYIRFVWRGKVHRESSGSRRKKVAVDLLKKRIAEVQDSTFTPAGSRTKLRDLLELTVSNYKKNGRRSMSRLVGPEGKSGLHGHLVRLLGAETPVDQVHERIEEYTNKRLEEGAKPGTINRELAALRRGFRLAIKHKRIAVMPMFEFFNEEEYVRTGFPEPEEIEGIIGELPDQLKPVVRFLSITGWRLGEGLNLEWRNIDSKAGEIRIERSQTKTRKVRTYPFNESPELAALIEERKAVTKAWAEEHGVLVPWVFWYEGTDRDGNTVSLPSELHWASRQFRLAAVRAKCAHITAHDLRRYVARRLIRNGVEESVAMKLLGHRTASVFRRYNITTGDDLRNGVRIDAGTTQERTAGIKTREA